MADDKGLQLVVGKGGKQRTGKTLPPQPLHEDVHGRVQKYRLAPAVHVVHVVEKAGSPSPRRHHEIVPALPHLAQQLSLQFSKTSFAPRGEQFGNAASRPFLDSPVEVDKTQPLPQSEIPGVGRFSAGHVTDNEVLHRSG